MIAFDVEHDPLGVGDACRCIGLPQISGACPTCLTDLDEPHIERGLSGGLILLPRETLDEFPQGASGENPHRNISTAVPIWDQEGDKISPQNNALGGTNLTSGATCIFG